MSQLIVIKIDRSTLPADGQKVKWQTYDEDATDTWKEGVFSSGDDLFNVGFSDTVSSWDQVWDVYHWIPIE